MGLADIADGVTRQVESLGASVNETLFEPTVRLGVTGLSRAGKSVFITSLVANLLKRGRMPQLTALTDGTLRSVYLQPQPDDTIARFPYETHLAKLTGPDPVWPENTRSVSELRLSFRVKSKGLIAGLAGERTVHLDIVDYPGEWLLDLALMDKSYADWSENALARIQAQEGGADLAKKLSEADVSAPFEEPRAQELAALYTEFSRAAHLNGLSSGAPGRVILPGELEGSPVLTFVPLPMAERFSRGSFGREMERRYEAYKSQVVKPFFRDHFARIDRQIVLVDVLKALHRGPAAVEDLRNTMGDILAGFRPGKSRWLTSLLGGKRVERMLFAATKADHLHHTQHPQLAAITSALLEQAKSRADFSGAQTRAMAIAALRTTTEATITHEGRVLDCVRGRVEGRDKQVAFYSGQLPKDPSQVLTALQNGADEWNGFSVESQRFLPAALNLKPDEGPPHIRLDQAVDFLIGDKLR
ncbi:MULTISPECIES: YcjX family protein [Halocynthiibacter]|uniref:YcjX family protein n=1 Tax=Halocynthiibacter halioticoli TaxID=2986804 RepID=A0AAE3LS92_9RHOB|nr:MULTISPECIES: YcjX family protein [Halocynthiibacter]MCV6825314.1 YcjX family protein [Halocynthiibacter halioticoli]MCW4058315.1 YcjX family protein [Halocynthiibacter sp. SDUM655004]